MTQRSRYSYEWNVSENTSHKDSREQSMELQISIVWVLEIGP